MPTAHDLIVLPGWTMNYRARKKGGSVLYSAVSFSRSREAAELRRLGADGQEVKSFTSLKTEMILVRKRPQRSGNAGYIWDK